MISLLRLVRFPNLLIIVAAQFLVRYCLIMPAYQTQYNYTETFPDHLSKLEFVLLVFSTLLIAAAGNIINDVFDVQTDEINKPGKNPVGKFISAKNATTLYFIFCAIGILAGFYIAFKIDKPVMGCVHVFAAGSLWMYSTYYKKKLLTGNILVALLSSLSLLIVGLFEPEFYPNISYLLIYTGFAFAVSFIREIIKDMEDVDGDKHSQSKTLPVVAGTKRSKQVLILLIALTAVSLAYILYSYFYNNSLVNFWNLIALFEIPFIALAYLVISAREKQDYHFASTFAKLIMVLGVFSLFPFYYFFLR